MTKAHGVRMMLTNIMCLVALASTMNLAQTTPNAPAPIAVLVPQIDTIVRRYMQDAHIPGLVYGVVRRGRLEHAGTMGVQELEARRPVTASTLFRVASMSKAFTALAILKLRDDGKVTLDALAETYVPEMRGWKYPTSDSPRLRVRDSSASRRLCHRRPLGDRQTVLPEADFTRMLREGVPFTRAPGIGYEYSNFGFALLGRIISNVSGRTHKDYIEQTIMRPLGMTDTGYDIAVSPPDVERWAIAGRTRPSLVSPTWCMAPLAPWAACRRPLSTTRSGSGFFCLHGRRAMTRKADRRNRPPCASSRRD